MAPVNVIRHSPDDCLLTIAVSAAEDSTGLGGFDKRISGRPKPLRNYPDGFAAPQLLLDGHKGV